MILTDDKIKTKEKQNNKNIGYQELQWRSLHLDLSKYIELVYNIPNLKKPKQKQNNKVIL